ncbi:hypothetical protein LTR05_008615 [Lithohypha guttulata]|uniref:Uncharacterized protein n=1 Tax=Lithohypha guttulata TaxID=1690604 RepID=A0AAN7SMR6_9EURO|nr:hypothetical protein LTR05_008615 [Lithohypha guttulata]
MSASSNRDLVTSQMTRGERLKSLEDFVRQKEMVRPDQDGTLPHSIGGMNRLVFGGPLPGTEYDDRFLPPPMYEDVYGEGPKGSQKKPGLVKKLLNKARGKNDAIKATTGA